METMMINPQELQVGVTPEEQHSLLQGFVLRPEKHRPAVRHDILDFSARVLALPELVSVTSETGCSTSG